MSGVMAPFIEFCTANGVRTEKPRGWFVRNAEVTPPARSIVCAAVFGMDCAAAPDLNGELTPHESTSVVTVPQRTFN